MILVLAVVVALGLIGGVALTRTVKRRALSSAEASRRSHLLSAYIMLLMAAVFVVKFIAVKDNFRYLLIALAGALVVTSLRVLRKNRLRSTPQR